MLVRILATIVSVCVYLIVTQKSGQISVVLENTSFYWQGVFAIVIALFGAVGFRSFQWEKDKNWVYWFEQVVFAFPSLLIVYRICHDDLTNAKMLLVGIATLLGVMLLSEYIVRVLRKHFSPRKIIFWVGVVLALLLITIEIGLRVQPVWLSRQIGSFNIMLIFLLLFSLIVLSFVEKGKLGFVALASFCFLFFTIEIPHEMKAIDITAKVQERGDPIAQKRVFYRWLLSRNDLDKYLKAGEPYPVFLVASEGGGGYAAAHAIARLSSIQQKCPNFAQHTFALVGVSGGAVGNAIFSTSLVSKTLNPTLAHGCVTARKKQPVFDVMRDDHLSPVLATMLFHDFPNKIFGGFFGKYDRSNALADSLKYSLGSRGLKLPENFLEHYYSFNNGKFQLRGGPAVISIATNSKSGERYVFAPFVFGNEKNSVSVAMKDIHESSQGQFLYDVDFLESAIASASFPWVTPSLTIKVSSEAGCNPIDYVIPENIDGERRDCFIQLVDGGYFDNSGADTIADIIGDLSDLNLDGKGVSQTEVYTSKNDGKISVEKLEKKCTEIKLKYRQSNSYLDSIKIPTKENLDECTISYSFHVLAIRAKNKQERFSRSQNFFIDPIKGILNARSRRGTVARKALKSVLCGRRFCLNKEGGDGTYQLYKSVIDVENLSLPLGWFMPETKMDRVWKSVSNTLDDEFFEVLKPPNQPAQ